MKNIPLTLLSASCAEHMGKLKLSSDKTVLIRTHGSGSFVCGYCHHTLIEGRHLPNMSNAAGICNNCGWLNNLTKPAKYPELYARLLKSPPNPDVFVGRKHSFVDSGPYTSFLTELNTKLYEYWSQYQRQRPPLLFHYTTIPGLIGILKEGNLWATDFRFLNDSSELQYAREMVIGRIEKEISSGEKSTTQRLFWERAKEVFKARPSDYRFLSCFCENGDLLSQWRGYAGGTGGFCIGFDSTVINELAITDPGFFLRRVIYDPEIQLKIIDDVISQINECIDKNASGRPAEEENNIIAHIGHVAGVLIEEFLYTFKHPSFYEEKEWRCVLTSGLTNDLDALKFRTSGASIVPYTELRFPVAHKCSLLPIRKIIQGPAANKDFGRIAIISLLLKYGYDFVEVEDSSVPLRF